MKIVYINIMWNLLKYYKLCGIFKYKPNKYVMFSNVLYIYLKVAEIFNVLYL